MKLAEVVFPHLKTIQEENINIKDLPAELQNAIKVFNLEKGKVERNETDEGIEKLKLRSVKIADDLQTYIERDLEEDKDDNSDSGSAPAKKETPPAAPEPIIPGFKPELPADNKPKNVKELMDGKGRIHGPALAKYMNVPSVNHLKDKLEVDGIKLERTLSFYTEVK